MKAGRGDNNRAAVQSVLRAIEILEALKDDDSLRLTDLQQQLSLSKGTIHRLLSTLAARGYVTQNSKERTYRLGLGIFQLASAALDGHLLREAVRDYMERLRDLSGETVHLGVMDRGEVVYIDRAESSAPVRVIYAIGQREPLHSTAIGKALLAFRPEEEIRSILATRGLPGFTRNTITDIDVMTQHLELVRRRGYAIDNEEHSVGIRCIAFPVRDWIGDVVAAVSISGPAFRLTLERIETLTGDLLIVAGEMSAHLGYRGPRIQTSHWSEQQALTSASQLGERSQT
jgi:IclR family KDG regulon transcriptional repressor